MRIVQATLYRFRLPLKKPFPLKGRELRYREGFLLKMTDEKGNSGWGEISPLPGLSAESLRQAGDSIHFLVTELLRQKFPDNFRDFAGLIRVVSQDKALYPSVLFGLEMAFLMLLAGRKNRSVARLFQEHPSLQIAVNAVLTPKKNDDGKTAEKLAGSGFNTLKLKIGRINSSDEINWVNKIAQRVKGKARLRLDANRAFDLADAVSFSRAIRNCPIDYIEEPLKNPARLPEFFNQTGMPVALDETLMEFSSISPEKYPGVCAYVYKPGIYGGVTEMFDMYAKAAASGIYLVLSSAFQTGLGIFFLANLAAALDQAPVAMGLGTLGWFEEDIVTDLPKPENGIIKLDHQTVPAFHLNKNRLKIEEEFSSKQGCH